MKAPTSKRSAGRIRAQKDSRKSVTRGSRNATAPRAGTAHARQALRNAESRFRGIFDYAPTGIAISHLNGHFDQCNPAFCTFLGYDEAELRRINFAELIHPDDRAENLAQRNRLMAGEIASFQIENRYLRKNGEPLWVHKFVSMLPDADGKPAYMLALIKDIAERKQVEQQLKDLNATLEQQVAARTADLQAAQRRLEHLLVSATGVIYSARPTGELGTMYMSDNVRQISGYEPRQFLDDEGFWLSRVHPDDVPGLMGAVAAAAEGGKRMSADYRFRCRDGSYRWMHDEAQPIKNAQGAVVEFVGYWTDITERKREAEQLNAYRADMEQAQQRLLVSHTIAAIAHELNQPLSAVTSYCESALHLIRSGQGEREQLAGILERGVTQAKRAGQTMRELLTVLHAHEARSVRLDLNLTIHDALRAFAHESDARLVPALNAPPTLPQVRGIPLYVEKTLLNLLRNAAEAMRGSGQIADANPRIEVSAQPLDGENFVQVQVRDFGPGVRADIAQKILQPFYTTKANGAGMGLAICRTLIETQGGRLWLDTSVTPGACFRFTLPCAE